jgi:hypothetical protein
MKKEENEEHQRMSGFFSSLSHTHTYTHTPFRLGVWVGFFSSFFVAFERASFLSLLLLRELRSLSLSLSHTHTHTVPVGCVEVSNLELSCRFDWQEFSTTLCSNLELYCMLKTSMKMFFFFHQRITFWEFLRSDFAAAVAVVVVVVGVVVVVVEDCIDEVTVLLEVKKDHILTHKGFETHLIVFDVIYFLISWSFECIFNTDLL